MDKAAENVRLAKTDQLSNHLGNVQVIVSDKILMEDSDGDGVSESKAEVLASYAYYPYGALMPGRVYNATESRYTFNGKELDRETGWQDYGFRLYDPDIARFVSVDPLTKSYPMLTPFQFASNSPIANIDLDGLEAHYAADGRVIGVGPFNEKTRIQIQVDYMVKSANLKRIGIDVNAAENNLTDVTRAGRNINVRNTNMLGGFIESNIGLQGRNSQQEFVTDYTATVVHDILQRAGQNEATISSAYRGPRSQAEAMYGNLTGTGQGQGVAAQRSLYGPSGEKVIDTYEDYLPISQGGVCSGAECIGAMTNTISNVGPAKISKHSSNPQEYNVIDIAPSSISNQDAFKRSVEGSQGVKKFIPYPQDPGHHLEIPQPKN